MNDEKALPENTASLPRSCVGWLDPFIGLGVIGAVFFGLRFEPSINTAQLSLLMITALFLFLGSLEIWRAPWRKAKPSAEPLRVIFQRAVLKMTGFFATLGGLIFFYWLFPEYHRDYYKPYFEVGLMLLPYIPPVFAAYFLFAEWRFPEYRDGSWQMAMLVLGRWSKIDWKKLHQYLLGWMVKGFFLAIMFGDLCAGLPHFRFMTWDDHTSFQQVFEAFYVGIVTIELVFVAAGYAFSARIFNSQLRTAEDTLMGWLAALMCYGPFLSITFSRYFGYRAPHGTWKNWLIDNPGLFMAWGSAILFCMLVHMWCDACFGLRFSNLTNRGVITNGCYRFAKHPAYVIKNIRWWLYSVPFIAGGWEGLRLSLLLLGVNLVYIWRCYCEEKLLSRDPDYQAYGLWMDKHGWLAWLGNALPFFKYETRLNYWTRRHLLKPMPTIYTQD